MPLRLSAAIAWERYYPVKRLRESVVGSDETGEPSYWLSPFVSCESVGGERGVRQGAHDSRRYFPGSRSPVRAQSAINIRPRTIAITFINLADLHQGFGYLRRPA